MRAERSSQRRAPRLICVTGADGAGKSTVIAAVAARLRRRGPERVATVTIWDVLHDRATVALPSRRAIEAYLAGLRPTSRVLFILHCWYEALARARAAGASVHLLDAYWYKSCAVEVAHGADLAEIAPLARVFPKPAAIFYLRLDPRVAARRKARISPYEAGFGAPATAARFVVFQRRADRALRRLLAGEGAVELDGRLAVDRIADAIVAAIGRGAGPGSG